MTVIWIYLLHRNKMKWQVSIPKLMNYPLFPSLYKNPLFSLTNSNKAEQVLGNLTRNLFPFLLFD